MDINTLIKRLDNINETRQAYQDNTTDFTYKVTVTMDTVNEVNNDALRKLMKNILQDKLDALQATINIEDV